MKEASGGAADPAKAEPDPGGEELQRGPSRRRFLVTGAAAVIGSVAAAKLGWDWTEGFHRSETFIGLADDYADDLVSVLRDGLGELGWDRAKVRGRSVLLKPNLVETIPGAVHLHTNPLMVAAVAEVFRRWDATEVLVAEGPAHHTDTWYLIEKTGMEEILHEHRLEFVDLNHGETFRRKNPTGFTGLKELMLPVCLRKADYVVSIGKLKTHHWAGITGSMKNLFGLMPGICYGWPKNLFHERGITESIIDINATVRPHLGIIDGIVGMQGDGPISGEPRAAGLIVMGNNLPALDATCARLMEFDPWDIPHLRAASSRLGPIRARHISQRGEPIEPHSIRFELPDHPYFSQFRPGSAPGKVIENPDLTRYHS